MIQTRQAVTTTLLAVLLLAAPARGQAASADSRAGEALDPAALDAGVVETVADMLARERTQAEKVEPGGRAGAHGRWMIPAPGATGRVHSGKHNLVNEWGDTRMGIGFARTVDVHGAYIAGQAAPGVWTPAMRVIGCLREKEVATTDWFTKIGDEPVWFEMDLRGIDRMVIECVPVIDGGGWYALDDLTYTILPMAGTREEPRGVVLDFEDTRYKQVLTGTDYAGLNWETGTGDFESAGGVPAPQTVDATERHIPTDGGAATRGGEGTLPELETSFQGPIRGDAGSFSYPPDTCGAVGPDHFVAIVNRNVSIYNKATGIRLANVGLNTFFSPFTTNGDPRVLYDQHSDRWFATSTNFSSGQQIQLAVSLSSDAMGSWFKTQFATDGGSDAGCWPDYPTLGVDDPGLYITSYMVGCGMTIFALDKAPLVAPAPALGTVTAFRGMPFEGAIQPVHTFGSPPGEYFISRTSSTSLRVRLVTGSLLAPTLQDRGVAAVPSHTIAPDAPALDSLTPLDTVDARLMNAVYRDGSIWAAHTIGVNGLAACRWYQVDPTGIPPTLVQSGTVDDDFLHYFFPSLMVNSRGDVVMGFTGSDATQYPGAYYTGRSFADPPGEMALPVQYRAGSGAQNLIDNFGRNRWGDYSLTSLDPDDELRMWTIQEYAHATNIWGTYIAQLAFGDCNNNGISDDDDISAGTSLDCNLNELPDECELGAYDCNSNGAPDDCDIAGGTSSDCNANATPDECDLAGGQADDCNGNEVPDTCDVAPGGGSDDCNLDIIPDECQLAGNDCDGNNRPDECDSADLATTIVGPVSIVHECPTNGLMLTVSAPGATAYQWVRNGDEPLSDGGGFSGTTSASLTIDPSAAGGDLSTYTCQVSFGCIVADSEAATLDVLPIELNMSLVTPSPLSGCAGGGAGMVIFTVALDDPTLAQYRWSKNGIDLSDGGNISGTHTPQLHINNVTAADSGDYRCRAWNPCIAEAEAVSTVGVLSFIDPVITSAPQDRCAEVSESAQFHAAAAGPLPFVLRWYEGGTVLSDGSKFSGTSTDTLTVHNVQLSDNGRQFRMRAIVLNPSCSTYSPSATLTALPAGGCPDCVFSPGDLDGDGDFDLVDIQGFSACFGADVTVETDCACANVDTGNDVVDLDDWTALEQILTGPL